MKFTINRRTASSKSIFRIEKAGDAIAGLAPPYVGDIAFREIQDETLPVQGDSFLAGSESLDLDTKCGGVRVFCRKLRSFFVKV
jgi:uncharacterized protein (AIM24 family)